jgi:hypothetical protein
LPDFPAFQNRGGNQIRRLGVDTGWIDEDRCTIASSDSGSVRLSGITVGITRRTAAVLANCYFSSGNHWSCLVL